MATVSTSFEATGVSAQLLVAHGASFTYDVSGTFVGTVVLERTQDGGTTFEVITSKAAAASGTVLVETSARGHAGYRFRCSAFTSGTIVTSLADAEDLVQQVTNPQGTVLFKIVEDSVSTLVRTSQKRLIPVDGVAKVGATAGFVVNGAANTAMATCPAEQTASTLVVPIHGLKVGDTITGFHLIGQIESAGGTVTVDANLRSLTAVAADSTDASIASITQLSVTADTAMTSTNTSKESLSTVVSAGAIYYILITATTGATTDIQLLGVAVTVTEA